MTYSHRTPEGNFRKPQDVLKMTGEIGGMALRNLVELHYGPNVPLDKRLTFDLINGAIHFIPAPDGRLIAVNRTGVPGGKPVLFYSGTPGCSNGPHVSAVTHDVDLITINRPGSWVSTPQPNRRPVDAAADAETVIRYFEERPGSKFDTKKGISIVGRSGGGPHALAVAARLIRAVDRIGLMATPPPKSLMGDAWYGDGLSSSNIDAFKKSGESAQLEAWVEEQTAIIRRRPLDFLRARLNEGCDDDRWVLRWPMEGIGRQLLMSYELGVKFSNEGWKDDLLGQRDWGFDIGEVEAQSLVWYGDQDKFVTPAQSRFLIDCLGNPEVAVTSGAGHFRAMREDLTSAVMDWCVSGKFSYNPVGPYVQLKQ